MKATLGVLVALAIALTGCGGSDDTDTDTAPETAQDAESDETTTTTTTTAAVETTVAAAVETGATSQPETGETPTSPDAPEGMIDACNEANRFNGAEELDNAPEQIVAFSQPIVGFEVLWLSAESAALIGLDNPTDGHGSASTTRTPTRLPFYHSTER